MAVAGLAIRPDRVSDVVADINAINKDYGVTSEVKWSTAKPRRNDIYRAYIDMLFALTDNNLAHFHIRFVPMNKYEHTISGSRRYVDTISKQFYQLLLHRAARYYGKECRILVRPDKGDCTSYLPKIIKGLNLEARSRFRLMLDPFSDVEPRDSRHEPILQLLDVTIGALCAARNGTHTDGSIGPYKRELIPYVLAKVSPHEVSQSTPMDARRFSLWDVKPQH